LSPSLSLNNAAIAAVANKIVQARKVYGKDSPYIIGLLAGIEMLSAGEEGQGIARQLQDRVLEQESGKGGTAPAPAAKASADSGKSRGQAAALAENEWIRGAVKWFNNDKGYGFISTESDTDVFVHWRDISSWDRSLTQGDEVEFMVTKTAKGFQAINVMKSDQNAQEGEAGKGAGEPAGDGDSAGSDSAGDAPAEAAAPAAETAPAAAPADDQASEEAQGEQASAPAPAAKPADEPAGDTTPAAGPEATGSDETIDPPATA